MRVVNGQRPSQVVDFSQFRVNKNLNAPFLNFPHQQLISLLTIRKELLPLQHNNKLERSTVLLIFLLANFMEQKQKVEIVIPRMPTVRNVEDDIARLMFGRYIAFCYVRVDE